MWQVFWNESAEQELTMIWVSSLNRQAVTDAANRLEKVLRHDPLAVGESREDTFRIAFVSPLVVQYHVSEPDRKVQVLQCCAERAHKSD